MSTISKSKIPTATHALNCIKGCPNCEKGICKSGGFPCWAAARCNRFAKAWAKAETNYITSEDRRLYFYGNDIFNFYKWAFQNFDMNWLHKEFKKSFPVKPSRIAVGWMSDISFWPVQWIRRTISKIEENNARRKKKGQPLHTFQFLTKFPEVYTQYEFPLNCWLGFTALNEKELCEKWEIYCDSVGSKAFPINKIFIYIEPITGAVNLKDFFGPYYFNESRYRCLESWINWLIVGGQGLGAKKTLNPDWIRKIRDDCQDLKIPFFFKGWGSRIPEGQEKGKIDGVIWNEFPES